MPNTCEWSDGYAPSEVPEGVAALTAKFEAKSAALPPNPHDQFRFGFGEPRKEWEREASGLHVKIGVEVFRADVHLGSQNDDGTQGENAGAMITQAGLDVTAEYSGWSLTAGLSLSEGASVSSGEGRDLDHDGKPERCFAVSYGPVTLGECDEL